MNILPLAVSENSAHLPDVEPVEAKVTGTITGTCATKSYLAAIADFSKESRCSFLSIAAKLSLLIFPIFVVLILFTLALDLIGRCCLVGRTVELAPAPKTSPLKEQMIAAALSELKKNPSKRTEAVTEAYIEFLKPIDPDQLNGTVEKWV